MPISRSGSLWTASGCRPDQQAPQHRPRFPPRGREGPQAVFDRLHQWIPFKRGRKSRGPIEEALRDYILDHFPIEPETNLFGVPVVARCCHSVTTLARQAGVHPKTVNLALVPAGLIPSGEPHRIDPGAVVAARAAEELIDTIRNPIPISAIPDWLNCHRTGAEALVQHGIPRSIVADERAGGSILKNVPVARLHRFLDRFRARRKTPRLFGCWCSGTPSEGMGS